MIRMLSSLKKVSVFALLFFLSAVSAFAQELETIAPNVVTLGRPFNVEYRIPLKSGRITMPPLENFIEIGQANSVQIESRSEGGQMHNVTVSTYTFVLVPQVEGVHSLPAVTLEVDGKTYTSKPFPIEVVNEGDTASQSGSQAGGRPQGGSQQQQQEVASADDLFLRAIPDKTTVYRGEPVRVRFKLYSRIPNLANEGAKIPSFNGFWSQSIDVSHYQPQRENYNSRVYNTFIVAEYLLYPTQSGVLKIDPMTMNMVIREMQRPSARTLEDLFMGGMPEIRETKKPVASPAVNITVKELPAGAPASFGGAVGNFTMTSEVPQGSITANSSSAYKIKISGTGNIPLIQAPKIEMPSSFEQYNSKMSEDTKVTAGGITGYRQFEYPFIARAEGNYNIAPVNFSYFNPQKGEYVTLATEDCRLEVMADTTGGASLTPSGGMVGGLSRKDLEILNRDIRFIKHDSPNLKPQGKVLMCSTAYFIIVGVLVALFIVLLIVLQRRIRQMKDAAMMRGKRANKVVIARLKVAEEFMKEGNQRRFHDEMLKALWGYLSDKLNIPVANLTKENVREGLLKRNVPVEEINRYVNLISDCEYAQYSPAESTSLQDVYRTAVEIISKFESYFRR